MATTPRRARKSPSLHEERELWRERILRALAELREESLRSAAPSTATPEGRTAVPPSASAADA
jgi:hypothetical protein